MAIYIGTAANAGRTVSRAGTVEILRGMGVEIAIHKAALRQVASLGGPLSSLGDGACSSFGGSGGAAGWCVADQYRIDDRIVEKQGDHIIGGRQTSVGGPVIPGRIVVGGKLGSGKLSLGEGFIRTLVGSK